jgi:hypothetical protein
MSNVYLQNVWTKAERALRDAEHVVFCGYSFPDADMHIKYMLKRAQTNSRGIRTKYTVVNRNSNAPPKTAKEKEQEKSRFERILGRVDYTKWSFEDFAANPKAILTRSKCNRRRRVAG